MATKAASTADDFTDNIRSLIDRVVDAKITHEMAKRGSEMGALANEAWKDSRPMRRDAAKALSRATDDAAKWSQTSLRPLLKDLWSRRTLALGAAGAAVPAGRELVDTAAVRLGMKQKEERHWGSFFLGLLFGIAAGAIAAMLTTPKRGDEMRRELTERADELATKARDEWVPIFERPTNGNVDRALEDVGEAAAEAGATVGQVGDEAADATAEAINEAYDTTEREPKS